MINNLILVIIPMNLNLKYFSEDNFMEIRYRVEDSFFDALEIVFLHGLINSFNFFVRKIQDKFG